MYKQKLTDRFIEIIEDFSTFDTDLALKMKTSDMEDLGIILAEAQKKLHRILEQNPSYNDLFLQQKVINKQKKIQSGKRQLPN
jgi:dsDNA-binding SOS-regulon protein